MTDKPKTEHPKPYYSDECLGMWELEASGVRYWFVSDALHPLQALAFILKHETMDAEIDNLGDAPDESWSIRHMGANEAFRVSMYGAGEKIGPLVANEDCGWAGTVQQAVDLCKFEGDIVVSEAWIP